MFKKNSTYKANLLADSGNQNIFYVIVLASVLIAMLIGLFAVTGNPIIVGLVAALVVGSMLLSHPVLIMWLVLVLGLLVAGLLPLHLDFIASKVAWGISLIGFFLMFIAFLRGATSPNILKGTPAFIWVALGFLIYTLLNGLIQWQSVIELIGGFKRYFQMWGILFALCWLAFDERDIHRWRRFFLIVALVQLPFAVYELIVFVPQLEGRLGVVTARDVVAGTFGASMDGGGASGEMATFLIIVLAFMLARRMENKLSGRSFVLLMPPVLVPLFLGETKAIIVLLPLMFLVLYRHEMLARMHYWLMGFIIVILLTVAASYTYLSFTNNTMTEQIEDIFSYNIYEKGYGHNYLNRTTVLTFWSEQQGSHDPISFIFGNGLGSSHDVARGHVSIRYPGYGIGLTAASTLLWDTGVFGFSLFISILALAWRSADRLRRESVEPTVRADVAAIQVALALFAFHLIYRLTLLELLSFQIVFAALLGYLAWLHRRHALAIVGSIE